MDKTNIILQSRYDNVHTSLEVLDGNRGLFTTDSAYVRTILNPNTEVISQDKQIAGIDFEGGPMVMVGDTIEGHTIKSIKGVFLVEFE